MLKKSTIQLLRFPFSYFLMPVYWFALSFTPHIHWGRAVLVFFLLHGLLYPSSNGYNSYMDRDTGSIGGIASPSQPTRQLFLVTVLMDILGLVLSFLVSPLFAGCFFCYILFSRLYSYRGIRLKRFPIIGYLTVILNQGALTFFMVYHGASQNLTTLVPWQGLVIACFLIGGFYPLTQVYQHQQDRADGVTTISMLLGKRQTFLFCTLMYLMAFSLLFIYYKQQQQLIYFLVLQICFLPVIVYFLRWWMAVWKNEEKADFDNMMKMNWLASTCTNLGFIILLIIH